MQRHLAQRRPGCEDADHRYEQGEGCDGAGRVAGHEPDPHGGADDGPGGDGVEQAEPGGHGVSSERAAQGMADLLRTLDGEGEGEHRKRRDHRHPQHQVHGLLRPSLTRSDVSQRPPEAAQHHQQEGRPAVESSAGQSHDDQPGDRDGDTDSSTGPKAFVEQQRAEQHGEGCR